MPDELPAEEARLIANAVDAVASASARLLSPLLDADPTPGSEAAVQNADPENYARTPAGDSAVAGTQNAILWTTLAAVEHAAAFASLVRVGNSFSPAVVARAGVEALGVAWYQVSAPDVRTLLQRNLNVRRAELYFPALHGVELSDGDSGAVSASALREELKTVMAARGYRIERVETSAIAAAVLDAALGGNGLGHYSQLSAVAHAALPMVALHMNPGKLRPSRSMVITAAVDLTGPLIHVVQKLGQLFDVGDAAWAKSALESWDLISEFNRTLP